MTNVTPIGSEGITPEVIMEHIAADLPKIRELYIVALCEDGQVRQYISGDIKGLAFAGTILHNHSLTASAANSPR